MIVKWHSNVLAAKQQKVLQELAPLATERNFYLAGGTAVALQLGHRRSIDFDWFSETAFADPLIFVQDLRSNGISINIHTIAQGTLHAEIKGVRTSFIRYKYPNLKPCVCCSKFGVQVASLEDLGCMKLSAIVQRGSKKDFVDIYGIMSRYATLNDLLKSYKKKYRIKDIAHVLCALTYFDDADKERMPVMLWNKNWHTIKQAIRQQVRQFG